VTGAANGEAYSWADIERARKDSGESYREFLRVPDLSAGVYRLAAGAEDPQTPHEEDEVYFVVRGSATLRVAGRDLPASEGTLLYVPARAEHRFHSIREDLELLVVFAPAEGTRATAGPSVAVRETPG
jgi:mannose-6-phosphate isomerase-like protein (cupin superfamily)